jgi:hypothetical protein
MLITALEDLARLQTLMPLGKANTLCTSLRVARQELDAALEDLFNTPTKETNHAHQFHR